ncbi:MULTISPECIES: valine--tRNA ligase [Tissierellales]|uniref:Valine--tRNA ligase n=1 Tax=Acidilutibacter cellobiosedens TaxID=2507161 RepID=A0A410QBD9_9FIRM|nr:MULTISPECIES: valine--tRNA ligase [Tissierellales]MBE6082170.1 valine--tRNA ligase [Tissierellaceae bacterium]QAT61311.1 valine--tRNA ligase [Acidilutibacter cellobiosedens]SCL95143.1 Valine-tRNA ligase [Sporanaerobacter sp. PP17-6a]
MKNNLPKTYNPKEFEDKLYSFWNDKGYFKAHVNKDKKSFSIMMPPPNVTGNLHLGHALNGTIQDILIRWKRMEGYEALWLPGTDHASISTEAKVVDKLKKEGKSKEKLGREKFLEEAWNWTEKYGGNIKEQFKKLGASCDWSRERFTLDKGLSDAVEEVFVRLYNKGLIYRGNRIINWCPNCKTALSDAEVEHEDTEGKLWYIRYPIKGEKEFITIATTRPETMLGDLAVAVNPKDERYKNLIGKTLILPLVNKEIPIIADEYVDMDFGSGAVKITPSHDPNDFEVGLRHNLGQFKIFNDDATINKNGGKYEGLDRYEARNKIIEDLKSEGYLTDIKEHMHSVGHCERCHTIVEPIISRQWFVKMEPLAEPALKAYEDGQFKFIPDRFGKIYTNWLENIRDWCISRQLWWGHRLPVYYCKDCGEVVVSKDKPKECPKCKSKNIYQDPDTLDTWFSSALWPFSTLGWPEETEDLKYFYPTDVLVTGYDIIFFWVVRMVFSALEQTGEVPFDNVFLTGLVRDSQGRKMSKSLGNGIDPLDVIDKYGADALRFTLVTGNSPGNDMRFYMERVESSRNFANKLWNATRFVMMNIDEDIKSYDFDTGDLEEEDKWILSRKNNVVREITENLDKYELGMAAQKIYDFIWDEFCDWYIEIVKGRLYGTERKTKETAQKVLLIVLKDILKMLHPFMPFITEEIWRYLPDEEKPLIISSWPVYRENINFPEAERSMEYIMNAIKGIRNIRSEMNVEPKRRSNMIFVTQDEEIKKVIDEGKRYFVNLAFANDIYIRDSKDGLGEDNGVVVLEKCEIYLPMRDLIDFEKERERLEREREKLESELKRVRGKLSNKGFIDKAPKEVVEAEREKETKYKDMMDKVLERLNIIKNN